MIRVLVGALLLVATAAPLTAEQFGLFGRTRTKTFTAGDFTMAYPDGGGWRQTAGAQDVLMLLNKEPDVRVAVIRMRVANPIATDDEELFKLFAGLEADQVRTDNSDVADVRQTLVTHATLGRVVRVDFTRQGAKPGVRERALQFSVPAGSIVYRLVFSGSPREFEKEVEKFDAMLASVRITRPASQDGAS